MRTFLLFVILYVLSTLNSTEIISITNITNPQLRFGYDNFLGTVLNFEDRIITSNYHKIIEYKILSDGALEEIGFYEKASNISKSFIDGDKYYFLDNISDYYLDYVTKGLYIFDLSHSPMKFVTYIKFEPSLIYNTDNIFFSEKHIMISDHDRKRTVLINKETYKIDGYIANLYGEYIVTFDKYLVNLFKGSDFIRVKVFEVSDNYTINEISALDIDNIFGMAVMDATYQDSKIVLTFKKGLIIIDCSDVQNPIICGSIHDDLYGFDTAFIKGNLLFTFISVILRVYEDDGFGNYSQIFNDICTKYSQYRNLCYIDSYLYLNAGEELRVYDVLNDFKLINCYGYSVIGNYPVFSVCENDLFYIKDNFVDELHEIYSVLDNTLICSLSYSTDFARNGLFKVVDDRLFLLYGSDTYSFFYVYQIENHKARLLKYFQLDIKCNSLNIYNNMIFLGSANQVFVYEINDDLKYMGNFSGGIQSSLFTEPTDYIFNLSGNKLFIRDMSDFNIILLEHTNSEYINEASIRYYNGRYFVVSYHESLHSNVYYFDINNAEIKFISMINSYFVTCLNEVVAANSGGESEYFVIRDNELLMIGSQNYPRISDFTYFFPERKKMVQVARSGIWVYDFEFDDVSDTDIVSEAHKTGLRGNYPNPFNPTTTVKFVIQNSEFSTQNSHSYGVGRQKVIIDIFNIKGQKVRTLVNDYFSSGEYSVVWNGHDDTGNSVSSGIYFCRMNTTDFNDTKKMILIK